MDIVVACSIASFEVIEIVDESNPYSVLVGIDWEFDMNTIIYLKKHNMKFEKKELSIIVPLDLVEGAWYTQPVQDYYEEDDIEEIYKLTTWDED